MDIASLSQNFSQDSEGSVIAADLPAPGQLHLRLQCRDWDNPDRWLKLELRCADVRSHRAQPCAHVRELLWTKDHPMLWDYAQPPATLLALGPAEDPHGVIGRLQGAHEALYKGWRDLRTVLNHGLLLHPEQLRGASSGMLASGPSPVMEMFQQALRDVMATEVRPSQYGMCQPTRDLHVLAFERCFVVCNAVTVHRLAPKSMRVEAS